MGMNISKGVYRHFKGKLYRVEGMARHSETLEEMVVYRQLYGDGALWVRPAPMWNETGKHGGTPPPPFALVGEAGAEE